MNYIVAKNSKEIPKNKKSKDGAKRNERLKKQQDFLFMKLKIDCIFQKF